jgi:4-hydroxybenzoate polyprenyltransferase
MSEHSRLLDCYKHSTVEHINNIMAGQRETSKVTLEFTLPTNSIFGTLPISLSPYIEITRMHIPPINFVCFSPFAVGLAFAANAVCLPWPDLLRQGAAAYIVALLAGCAGHTLDDCLDYDIDRKYDRCQSRPIVRGHISLRGGFIYAVSLLAAFLVAVQLIYGTALLPYGIACVVLFWAYPLSKRFWNYPQLVIGILHAIPIPWMAAALGIDPLGHTQHTVGIAATYAAFALCTTIFDTGYGLLDAENDLKFGVGSMSVLFKSQIHTLLWSLASALIGLLVIAGRASGFGGPYSAGCAAIACHLAYLISHLDPDNSKSAIDFFMSVNALIPAQLALALLADYTYTCHL